MVFDPKRVEDIELNKFRRDAEKVSLYTQGKDLLVRSGIVDFLRIFSRPYSRDRGSNVYAAAYSAAYTEGYNKCLDDMVYFEEMYLGAELQKTNIIPNFGGLALAQARGDLTDKEVEALKNGKH